MLQVSSDEEALDEEEVGNGATGGNAGGGEGNAGGEGNTAEGDGDWNTDDKSDLRDVLNDPNENGVAKAITEAEAEAQREHQEMEAEEVTSRLVHDWGHSHAIEWVVSGQFNWECKGFEEGETCKLTISHI